jgi:hypothetical protein
MTLQRVRQKHDAVVQLLDLVDGVVQGLGLREHAVRVRGDGHASPVQLAAQHLLVAAAAAAAAAARAQRPRGGHGFLGSGGRGLWLVARPLIDRRPGDSSRRRDRW